MKAVGAVDGFIAKPRCGGLLRELERSPASKGGELKSVSAVVTPIPKSPYAQAIADAPFARPRIST